MDGASLQFELSGTTTDTVIRRLILSNQEKTVLAIPMEAVHTSSDSFGYTYKLNILSQGEKTQRQRIDITSMHDNFVFATNLAPGKYVISEIEMHGRSNALTGFHHHILKKPIKFEVFQGKVTLLPYVFTVKTKVILGEARIQENGSFQILTQQKQQKFKTELKRTENFHLWTLYDAPVLHQSVLAEEKASSIHPNHPHGISAEDGHTISLSNKSIK